jgi:TIR domain
MPNRYDVFLAHSNDDAGTIVEVIARFFERLGLRVFEYTRVHGRYGERLPDEIDQTIRGCRHLVLFLTDSASTSKWVRLEIDAATRYHINLVPIRSVEVSSPPELSEVKQLVFKDTLDLEEKLKGHEWRRCVDVYIPAGGFSGSTYEFSQEIPKVLYPIGDKPLLFHVLNSLSYEEFGDAIVLNRTAPDYIRYLTGLIDFPLRVECRGVIQERWPIALADQCPKRTFVLQLADNILHLGESTSKLHEDWRYALDWHRECRQRWDDYLGTLIVSRHYKLAVGTVKLGKTPRMQVESVGENPYVEDLIRDHINTGCAILEPEILNYVETDDSSLHGGAIERAVKSEGKKFGSYLWGPWYHVLNVDDYRNVNDEYSEIVGRTDKEQYRAKSTN